MKEQDLANTINLITESEVKCKTYETELSDLRLQISDKKKVSDRLVKLSDIKSNLQKTISKVSTDIDFYHDNSDCPTCKQGIAEDHKTHIVEERNKKLKEVEKAILEIDNEIQTLKTRKDEIELIDENIQDINSNLTSEQSEIIVNQRYSKSLEKEIARLKENKSDLQTENTKLSGLNDNLLQIETEIKEFTEERAYYDVATSLLKDTGIKTKIIRQYIPIINKLVNKYLASLDFFVNFNLDESFKETIKSRHRDDFTYASFSEGEKQRIDMALMLTWRSVAKLKNSASTNILILDEIFDSSLDTNGTEDLMKILGMLEGSNLFVISHKGDMLQDKFMNVIKFEKVNNFSRITK